MYGGCYGRVSRENHLRVGGLNIRQNADVGLFSKSNQFMAHDKPQ